MRTRHILSITVALGALAGAPAASAQSFTIVAKRDGTVPAIGDFKPERDATLGAAIRAFGQPSSTRPDDVACRLSWRAIGVRISFANFGTGSACDPELGKSQSATISGDRRWRTPRGLQIGDGLRKLRRLYPRAKRNGRSYRLVGARSPFGDGRVYSVLAARVSDGRVGSFKMFIGAAGE